MLLPTVGVITITSQSTDDEFSKPNLSILAYSDAKFNFLTPLSPFSHSKNRSTHPRHDMVGSFPSPGHHSNSQRRQRIKPDDQGYAVLLIINTVGPREKVYIRELLVNIFRLSLGGVRLGNVKTELFLIRKTCLTIEKDVADPGEAVSFLAMIKPIRSDSAFVRAVNNIHDQTEEVS
jgi:hypothetical protein